jgi:hypothetical protein
MHEVHGGPLEYVNWKDGGCDLHPACLECPLPHCIEEQPRGRQKRRLDGRGAAMAVMAGGGITVREIAVVYEVSVRTVQRALKRNGNGNGHK